MNGPGLTPPMPRALPSTGDETGAISAASKVIGAPVRFLIAYDMRARGISLSMFLTSAAVTVSETSSDGPIV